MRALHRLHRQRQRMSAAARMATRYGDKQLAYYAGGLCLKLNGWAAMTVPADAPWLAGQLGRNGLGPALDDIAKSVRAARHRAPAAEQARAA